MQRSALAALLLAAAASSPAAEPKVAFNRDIRPIFSDTCFACHGPDKNQRQAGLRLDVRDSALATLESGVAAIVPGKPEQSELVRRITTKDDAERMPPPEHHKDLTPQQVALLTRWVAEGAEYEPHWAYIPPTRPALPTIKGGPAHNPIDLFIQSRLQAEGLSPSPEADKRTLIRRVTLDLHGLPPSSEEVAAFVADASPDAYEKLVNRLLASPRFAERQAMFWLDAVRYADTVGFHGDQLMNAWPYRDYVLRAFHENKPFDEFTREQIAGDLLPNATRDQKVATAFNRLNRMTTEGGAQDREYLAKYAADRVRTLGAVWLGSTTGCCECHDHKFDPFTTRDFYRLEAFFADVEEKGFYPNGYTRGGWGPSLDLPSPEQQAELARLDAELAKTRAANAAVADDALATGRADWENRTLGLDKASQLAWATVEPTALATEHGATLTHDGGGLVSAGGPNPDNETYAVTFEPGPGRWTALLVEPVGGDYPGQGIARGWVSFILTEVEAEASSAQAGSPAGSSKRLAFAEAIAADLGDNDRFPPGAAIDGDPATGWGNEYGQAGGKKLLLRLAEPLETTADTTLTVRLRHDSAIRRATMGRFRLKLSRVEAATAEPNGLPDNLLAALRAPAEQRNDEQKKLLAARYRQAAPELADLRRAEAALFAKRAQLAANVPNVLVTQARPEPRPIRVLPRGNWMDDSGEVVEPNVPEFLGLLDTPGRRANRLDLANWLVSKENPLTARVFVNRLWKQFFGTGLSKVLEDVGSQGEWPSHPELLDWLAVELMQPSVNADGSHPWDVKHAVKLIVTSHAYRQISAADAKLAERDPANRLLARQTPVRVEAETVRDIALAASGLLKDRFGGPSVYPVQPDGYWAALNFPRREYAASRGDDLYRRSIYTHWQRTFLHPSLLVFDAATREECTVNRTPSNTPLQALVLLNDPIFVEAARAFAQKAMTEAGQTPTDRLAWAFTRATGRTPDDAERETLRNLYTSQLAEFRADPASADALLTVGEAPRDPPLDPIDLAALTTVTRAILNLHETITRD